MISLSVLTAIAVKTPPPPSCGILDSCRLAIRAGGLCSGDGGDGGDGGGSGVKGPSVQSFRLLNKSQRLGHVWSRGRGGRGQCGGTGVNNRSDSMCQQLLNTPTPLFERSYSVD